MLYYALMNKKNQNLQTGSAHVGIVVVIMLLICGAIGYKVYETTTQKNTNAQLNSTSSQVKKTDEPKAVVKDDDIAIKEASSTFVKPVVNQASEEATPQNGQVTGSFTQAQNSVWPTGQEIAYIGVSVTPANPKATVSKVEWYLDDTLYNTATKPSVGNLYQYDWPIAKLVTGWYHWTAKVYDSNGNYQLVRAQDGKPYINMKVTNLGAVKGKFVQQQNTSWPNKQEVAYVGLNVSDPSKVSKVEWYLGKIDPTNLQHTAYKANVGTLYQYDWPIAKLPKGTYRWRVLIYDTNGLTRQAANNLGKGYVDMLVKSN